MGFIIIFFSNKIYYNNIINGGFENIIIGTEYIFDNKNISLIENYIGNKLHPVVDEFQKTAIQQLSLSLK